MEKKPYNVTIYSNSKDAQFILDVVNKYGCLAKDQIKYFFKFDPNRPNRDFSHTINYLVSTHQVIEDDNVLCSKSTGAADIETIDSIWVLINMIERFSSEGVSNDEEVREAFCGDKPETIGFFLNKQTVIRLIPVYSSNDITGALFVQERFYSTHNIGDEDKVPVCYYFIIRDKERLKALSDINLTINHKVALLSGDLFTKPEIKYLNPPKQATKQA